MSEQLKNLSDIQLSIMNVLWDLKEGGVSDVLEHLSDKDYARTTVATMLTRLEKQDIVKSKKVDGKNIYMPAIKRQEVQKRSLKGLLKNLFSNRKTELVSHLLSEDASSDDIDEVIKMLEEKKQSMNSKGKKG